MKTSTFLSQLRSHGALPLVFRAQGEFVSPGYHLTEVKRVSYETMDCGAMTHRWSESQFEIWVPAAAETARGRGHMAGDKFLRIVDRVEAELPLQGDAVARIHASFKGQPAALHDIESVTTRGGELWVELSPDRARCKAAERREAGEAGAAGGCCGTEAKANAGASSGEEPALVAAGCGCGAPASGERKGAAVCCA